MNVSKCNSNQKMNELGIFLKFLYTVKPLLTPSPLSNKPPFSGEESLISSPSLLTPLPLLLFANK